MEGAARLALGGELIEATYRLACDPGEAAARARAICVEQTVEFPEDLIARADIREQVIGRVLGIAPAGPGRTDVVVAYPAEAAGAELPQLLNLLFGNVSIQPGIRLQRFALPAGLARRFRGPRFGRAGLRALLGAPAGPLVGSAIKPMGLSPRELADLAHRLALGGLDVIKDDHGLADQPFARFRERVERVAEAVARAREATGRRCRYLANVTGPCDEIAERCRVAKAAGAGGCVLAPGLAGFDAMRRLADDDDLALPIFSHPALLGAFTADPRHGIAHGALYGAIGRLAGADACIFPSFGGRFAFAADECAEIAEATAAPLGALAPSLPVPAGGMRLDRAAELGRFYGDDVLLLIGGDLHRHGPDLAATCRELRRRLRGAG